MEYMGGGVNVRFLPVLDGRYAKSRDVKAYSGLESSMRSNTQTAHLDEILPLQLLTFQRGNLEQRREDLMLWLTRV